MSLFSSLLFLNSCSEDIPSQPQEDLVESLTQDQLEMKANLDNAAQLLAGIINDAAVHKEVSQLSYLNNEYNKLSFKNLLQADVKTSKGSVLKFSNLKNEILSKFSASKSSNENNDLLEYLIANNCYLYVPYSLDWYPEDKQQFTVAPHPIDNTDQGVGYRSVMGNEKSIHNEQVIVDEVYAEDYPVIIIMPYPPDDGGSGGDDNGGGSSAGDPIYEVKTYEFWCVNKCGGLFEGDIEMHIVRGYAINATTGNWLTQFTFDYPRDLVNAAEAGEERAWKRINTVWDPNWKEEKDQQVIAIFDYDWDASKKTISGSVKWKGITGTVSFELPGKKYRASPLLVETELDRGQFFSSQESPGSTDEVRDGRIVRQWGDVKVVTHIETRSY